jgi:hypothetical protein
MTDKGGRPSASLQDGAERTTEIGPPDPECRPAIEELRLLLRAPKLFG